MIELRPMKSVAEVARLLGVTPPTVRAAIRRGELRARRVGRLWRVPAEECERLLGPGPTRGGPSRRALEREAAAAMDRLGIRLS